MLGWLWSGSNEAPDEKYFRIALNKFRKAKGIPVSATAILMKFMKDYKNNGYWRNHRVDAEKCVEIMQNRKDDCLPNVMDYLERMSRQKGIDPGDFSLLLNTFFTLYPSQCPKEGDLLRFKKTMPFFENNIISWQRKWIGAMIHSQYMIRLEEIAELMPNQPKITDHFAEKLLTLLTPALKTSDDGMTCALVYSALGNLYGKLSIRKQLFLYDRMKAELEVSVSKLNASVIGLAKAMYDITCTNNHLSQDASAALISYFMQEPDRIFAMYQSDHGKQTYCAENLRAYWAQQLFVMLNHYSVHYKDQQKELVMTLLIEDSRVYKFRYVIEMLREWLSQKQRSELCSVIARHDNAKELKFLFHPWLLTASPFNASVAMYDAASILESGNPHSYDHTFLTRVYVRDTTRQQSILDNVDALVTADNVIHAFRARLSAMHTDLSVARRLLNGSIICEFSRLPRNDRQRFSQDFADIFRAIPLLSKSFKINKEERGAFCQEILAAAELADERAQVLGYLAAQTMYPEIAKLPLFSEIRSEMFVLLDDVNMPEAEYCHQIIRQSLIMYAQHMKYDDMPAFMAMLAASDNFHAYVVLCKVHEIWLKRSPQFVLSKSRNH